MLAIPLIADNLLKSHQKFDGKKNEFANIVVTFARSPIAIYATYLSPVYLKFNAQSNPLSVWYTDEEKVAKTRDFNRNGKIFLKLRIYPSPIVNGLDRHFESTCTQYVC